MHNVAKICRKAIDILNKHADSGGAEAFEDTLGEITRCLRVLTMIGGPLCLLRATGGRFSFDGHAATRTTAAKATQ